jgi:hypothetical protein
MLADWLMMAARQISPAVPTSGAATSSSTLSIAKPNGIATGALMVAFIVTADGVSRTAPPGWERQRAGPSNADVYTKRVEDGEPSSFEWRFGEATSSQGFIAAFGGADFDAMSLFSGTANPAIAGSVTASAANSLAVAWFARGANGSISFSTPSGWTPLIADTDASSPSSALFTRAVGAGATGAASSTPSSGGGSGLQIVLKPR